MNSESANTFSNRELVAMVRAELDAVGRSDVAISRSWIDEDQPGLPFLLHVPVGTELSVPLRAKDDLREAKTGEEGQRHAAEFAKALINLKSAERMLVKYAHDVRRAARAAVASARAEGLDILLDRVGFKPTSAFHLTFDSWKEAANHVLAEVTVRHTSVHLRRKSSTVQIEDAAGVAEMLADLLEKQRERQDRLAELEARGCDLVVDQLTLDLLDAHGLDAREMLTRVWKEQRIDLKVRYAHREISMSLVGSDGRAWASVMLPNANWNGEHLWFRGVEQSKDHGHLIGESLGSLVQHPAFTSRPIVDVFHRHTDHVVFDLSDKVMFDADTGRLWREDRLAA